MTKLLVLLAVVACSKTDDTKPGSAADPWATPSSTPSPSPSPSSSSGSAADPWGAPRPTPAPAEDPWAAKPAPAGSERPTAVAADVPVEPPPEPAPQQASGGASALAGSYQCQQLRYGTMVNGIRQSNYVSSALGVFEVDGDGSYRSASYPGKGTGRTRVSTNNVTFEGGPYPGSVGLAGTTGSGSFYIRFSGNLTDAPRPSMQFNDHMCYRK